MLQQLTSLQVELEAPPPNYAFNQMINQMHPHQHQQQHMQPQMVHHRPFQQQQQQHKPQQMMMAPQFTPLHQVRSLNAHGKTKRY